MELFLVLFVGLLLKVRITDTQSNDSVIFNAIVGLLMLSITIMPLIYQLFLLPPGKEAEEARAEETEDAKNTDDAGGGKDDMDDNDGADDEDNGVAAGSVAVPFGDNDHLATMEAGGGGGAALAAAAANGRAAGAAVQTAEAEVRETLKMASESAFYAVLARPPDGWAPPPERNRKFRPPTPLVPENKDEARRALSVMGGGVNGGLGGKVGHAEAFTGSTKQMRKMQRKAGGPPIPTGGGGGGGDAVVPFSHFPPKVHPAPPTGDAEEDD